MVAGAAVRGGAAVLVGLAGLFGPAESAAPGRCGACGAFGCALAGAESPVVVPGTAGATVGLGWTVSAAGAKTRRGADGGKSDCGSAAAVADIGVGVGVVAGFAGAGDGSDYKWDEWLRTFKSTGLMH